MALSSATGGSKDPGASSGTASAPGKSPSLSLVNALPRAEPVPPPGERHPDAESTIGGSSGEELNVRLLQPVVSYTSDRYGEETARRILARTGLRPSDLTGKRYWVSLEAFEAVLAACRAIFADDEEFRAACRYRLAESYGPLRFLVRAASVGGTLALAARTMHLVSRISRYEVLDVGSGHIVLRYTSDKPESRLMCLSRIGATEAFATLWGLPQAVVEERGCVAKGDEACLYHVRWYEQPRWLPALVGALVGGAGTAAMLALGGPAMAAWLLPLVGGLAGHMVELRKVNRRNVAYSEESNETLRELARRNTEAIQEITALNQRHRDWSRLLEAQITDRQRQTEEALHRMGAVMSERHLKATQATHDMRNPLVNLKTLKFLLEPHLRPGDEDAHAILEDAHRGAVRVDRLVRELLGAPLDPLGISFPMKAEPLEVAPLAERLRRRLQAQTIGKDIRVSAFVSREAPAEILTDHLIFDRVVDNLITNAARYTDQGSVMVELGGSSGSLVVKLSDTGPGLSEEELRHVFQPGQTGRLRSPDSHGLGLSIVVTLLDQIGGRLEVLSRPGMGTTFWAHFPIAPQSPVPEKPGKAPETSEEVIGRVVTFRAAHD